MAEYVSLYSSTTLRRSLSDMESEFREKVQGEDALTLSYRYPSLELLGNLHRINTDFGPKQPSPLGVEVGCPCCKTQYRSLSHGL